MRDTCGIHTCILSEAIKIHVGYIRDTCRIHDEIHVSQMHRERDVSDMQETCEIHILGDMYPQRQSRYIRDTSEIHAGYMRNTCGIRISYLGCQGEICIDVIIMCTCAAHLNQATHCLLVCKWVLPSPAPSSCPIICFVMATLIQPLSLLAYHLGRQVEGEAHPRSAPPFPDLAGVSRCIPYVSHLYRMNVS